MAPRYCTGKFAELRDFDTIVIALAGERGRDVREFLDDALAMNRLLAEAVVVIGDEGQAMRCLAPKTAMTIAEFFATRSTPFLSSSIPYRNF